MPWGNGMELIGEMERELQRERLRHFFSFTLVSQPY